MQNLRQRHDRLHLLQNVLLMIGFEENTSEESGALSSVDRPSIRAIHDFTERLGWSRLFRILLLECI